MLINEAEVFWAFVQDVLADTSEQGFEDVLTQDEVGTQSPQLLRLTLVAAASLKALNQSLASHFGQVVGGTANWILSRLTTQTLLHSCRQLLQGKTFRHAGQRYDRLHDRTVASFIHIQARQSSVASLGRLGPTFKLACIQKANMRGLHDGQKADQHLLHATEQLRQLVQQFARFERGGVEHFNFGAQDPLAFVVDLKDQIAPADFEDRHVVGANPLHLLAHFQFAASRPLFVSWSARSEEHTSELQSQSN